MIVSLLVAMDEKNGIGLLGRIPWRLPDEMRLFKRISMGHHILMGRKTYESIGRALPGRVSVVITRSRQYLPLHCTPPDCLVVNSLDEAFQVVEAAGDDEAVVIGGAEIYALALPLAQRLHLTRIHAVVEADTFFPPINPLEWNEVEKVFHPADERHPYAYTYFRLDRVLGQR